MVLHGILCLAAVLLLILAGIYRIPKVLFPKADPHDRFIRSVVIVAAAEILLFITLYHLIGTYTLTNGGWIPVIIVLIAGGIPFLTLWLSEKMPDKKHFLRLCRGGVICAMVLLLAEVFIFNGKSLTAVPDRYMLTTDNIQPELSEQLTQQGDAYNITRDAQIELVNLPAGTNGIILDMAQEQNLNARLMRVWLEMKDDNFKYKYQSVADRYTMASDMPCTLTFEPYGEIRSLLLHFENIANPVTLTGIEAVSAVPFRFSVLRYLVLLVLVTLIAVVVEYRLYEVTYAGRKPSHIFAVGIMVIVCTCSASCFWQPGEEMIEYSQGKDYSGYGPYVLTFDAMRKGQVFLDMTADPALEELENVYDNSERAESGVSSYWDYAYYNGKYYSYFGVTPVLVLYRPLYVLTGKLPTEAMTVDIFATASAFFLCMAILAAVRLTVRKPNLVLLLLSFPAAVCTSGVYICMQYPDRYYVAVSAGMCFLLLTLWLGLRACSVKQKKFQYILFVLCGISLALCAGARPTMAVSAAVLLPFFFGILLRKSEKFSHRMTCAGCFLVPLLAGVGGLLAYNNARFGSPMDFGASYQLTVSDVHANTLNLSLLPAAIRHYFLQFPVPRGTFPFFENSYSHLRNYGRYVYADACAGALAYPLILAAIGLLPLSFRRNGTQMIQGVATIQKRIFLAVCFAVPLVLAWMDFCMGGINQRYITDIMPLLTLGAVIVFLRSADVKHHTYRYGLMAGILALTFCIVWLLMIGLRDCTLLRHYPDLYDIAEDLLIFWQ